MSDLTPGEQSAADEAVARFRAEMEVVEPGPFEIDHEIPDSRHSPDDKVEQLRAEEAAAEVEDFDAFWAAQSRTGKVLRNVCGIDLHLPRALPLAFEVESRRLMQDRSIEGVHRLFALLFGQGALDDLIAEGLDGEQLSVLLMWGSSNGNGRDMSLGQAQVEFEKMKARQAAGKSLVPAASGGTSSDSGRSSRPTSPANTRSQKTHSRH